MMYDMNEIIPRIFLGNIWSTSPESLIKNNIQCILNVSSPETDANRGPNKIDIEYKLVLPIEDNEEQKNKMRNDIIPPALDFINKHREYRILIHCSAGRSSSATVLIAWLIQQGYTYRDAYNLVNSRRIISLNKGFKELLETFQ